MIEAQQRRSLTDLFRRRPSAPSLQATPAGMDLSHPEDDSLVTQTNWSSIPDEAPPDGLVVSQNPNWEVTQ